MFFVGILFYTTFGSFQLLRSKLRVPWMLIVSLVGVSLPSCGSDWYLKTSQMSWSFLALRLLLSGPNIWGTSRGK